MSMHLKPRRIAFEECLVHVQVWTTPLNVQVGMARFAKKNVKRSIWGTALKVYCTITLTYVQN